MDRDQDARRPAAAGRGAIQKAPRTLLAMALLPLLVLSLHCTSTNKRDTETRPALSAVPAATAVAVFAGVYAAPEAVPEKSGSPDAELPPELLRTIPEIGAADIDPDLGTITVTFDRDMRGGFSWTGGGSWTTAGGTFPEVTGGMQWSEDRKTCTLPVKLEPGVTYRVGLNSEHHINFQSESGVPSDPEVWEFTAGSEAVKH